MKSELTQGIGMAIFAFIICNGFLVLGVLRKLALTIFLPRQFVRVS